MVKQLIVLGNGFDRAAGLESDYEGFIDWLLSEADLTFEGVTDGTEWLLRSLKHPNQAENDLASKTLKINAWILLLLNARVSKDTSWANVEDKMRWYLDNEIIRKIATSVRNPGIFFTSQPNYLGSSIELIAFKIRGEGRTEITSEEEVADYLYEQLQDLESSFESYLFGVAGYNQDNKTYFEGARELLTEMVGEDDEYNVQSFNYTDPWNSRWDWQGLLKPFKEPSKVINVHGEAIVADVSQNRLIFGIDNIGVSAESLEYMFTKSFRTMIMSADPTIHPSVHRDDVFDSDVTDIKFYGHSLAPADYAYFQQMFDFYNLYENNNITLTFYYTPYGDQTSMDAIRWQASAVSKLIEKYGETLDNGKPGKGKNLFTRLQLLGRIKIQRI